jgi:lipopolysaccharide export system permease protein
MFKPQTHPTTITSVIIFRYLVKEVYSTLFATTAVLLLLLISNQFVRYLTQAAAGVVPLRTVMQMMSLQIPLLLGLLLPLGLYLGILMAYGRLYVDREMTVMSACGLSKAQLTGMTLTLSAVICLIVAVLMLWLQPKTEGYKRQVLIDAASSSPLERIAPEQFTTLPNSPLVFYAENLSRDHQRLENIFVAQRANTANAQGALGWDIVVAREGHQQIDPKTNDKFIVFEQGYRYSGIPGEGAFQVSQYKTYGVRIEQNAIPEDKRPETYATPTLIKVRHTDPKFEAELQWRFALPISTMILAIIALALCKVDPRQGRFAQLFPAFLLYIAYINLMFVGRAWLQKGVIPAEIGLWWVHVLMGMIALLLWLRFIGFARVLYLLKSPRSKTL